MSLLAGPRGKAPSRIPGRGDKALEALAILKYLRIPTGEKHPKIKHS